MKNEVREQMGSWQLQFVEFTADLSYYQYPNAISERMFKTHNAKWNQHKAKFRGRKCICIITQQRDSSAGKSGSTYDIKDVLAVLAVFESPTDLKHFSEQYWFAIKSCNTDQEKSQATVNFIRYMHDLFKQNDVLTNIYQSGLKTAHTLYLNTELKWSQQ